MMKRMGIAILIFGFVFFMGTAAQAVPSLGVGGELQTCGADYWTCFAGNSASGSGESFSLPASGGDITIWSNITGANIWLLAEPSLGTISFGSYGSSSMVYVGGGDGKLASYQTPYQGINLGQVNGGWSSFPAGSPFDTGQDPFKYLAGALTYTGTDVSGDWLFVVADIGNNYGGAGAPFDDSGSSHDIVSPKTTSMVPEPGTLMLLGSGLVGLGIYRRKIKA